MPASNIDTSSDSGNDLGFSATPLREASQLHWALGMTKVKTVAEFRQDATGVVIYKNSS